MYLCDGCRKEANRPETTTMGIHTCVRCKRKRLCFDMDAPVSTKGWPPMAKGPDGKYSMDGVKPE